MKNHWLCTDSLFLMETEGWLYIFVSLQSMGPTQ